MTNAENQTENQYLSKKEVYILIISIGLILSAAVVLITVYFNILSDECLSSPLVYGAKEYEDRTGIEVYGALYFLGYPTTITFNSKNISSANS